MNLTYILWYTILLTYLCPSFSSGNMESDMKRARNGMDAYLLHEKKAKVPLSKASSSSSSHSFKELSLYRNNCQKLGNYDTPVTAICVIRNKSSLVDIIVLRDSKKLVTSVRLPLGSTDFVEQTRLVSIDPYYLILLSTRGLFMVVELSGDMFQSDREWSLAQGSMSAEATPRFHPTQDNAEHIISMPYHVDQYHQNQLKPYHQTKRDSIQVRLQCNIKHSEYSSIPIVGMILLSEPQVKDEPLKVEGSFIFKDGKVMKFKLNQSFKRSKEDIINDLSLLTDNGILNCNLNERECFDLVKYQESESNCSSNPFDDDNDDITDKDHVCDVYQRLQYSQDNVMRYITEIHTKKSIKLGFLSNRNMLSSSDMLEYSSSDTDEDGVWKDCDSNDSESESEEVSPTITCRSRYFNLDIDIKPKVKYDHNLWELSTESISKMFRERSLSEANNLLIEDEKSKSVREESFIPAGFMDIKVLSKLIFAYIYAC